MRPLIIANWKMNPQSQKETKELFDLVKRGFKNVKNAEVIICPSFIFLSNVKCPGRKTDSPKGCMSNVILGAQDCFWEEKGAFTGEISPVMLKNLGVKYVILGHSERRQYLGETDEMVNRKIRAVIKEKLSPILCVGETKEEREKGRSNDVLRKQITLSLKNIPGSKIKNSKLVIAYEPVWAIGTGNACEPDEAMTSAILIKKILTELYNNATAQGVAILYGGSVDSKNAADYIKGAGLNGLLVGGASLKPQEFIKIVKSIT